MRARVRDVRRERRQPVARREDLEVPLGHRVHLTRHWDVTVGEAAEQSAEAHAGETASVLAQGRDYAVNRTSCGMRKKPEVAKWASKAKAGRTCRRSCRGE